MKKTLLVILSFVLFSSYIVAKDIKVTISGQTTSCPAATVTYGTSLLASGAGKTTWTVVNGKFSDGKTTFTKVGGTVTEISVTWNDAASGTLSYNYIDTVYNDTYSGSISVTINSIKDLQPVITSSPYGNAGGAVQIPIGKKGALKLQTSAATVPGSNTTFVGYQWNIGSSKYVTQSVDINYDYLGLDDTNVTLIYTSPFCNYTSVSKQASTKIKRVVPLVGVSDVIENQSIYYTIDVPATYVKKIVWSSNNGNIKIETPNTINTKVTGVKEGKSTLTVSVTTTNDKVYTVAREITVKGHGMKITPSGNIACVNNTVSFTVTNLLPGATVAWTAGANFTLVSGQNAPTAVFKMASQYSIGYGTVKTVISHNGINYNLENSDVWLGTPKMGISGYSSPSDIYSSYFELTGKATLGNNVVLRMAGYGESGATYDYEWKKNNGDFAFTSGGGYITNPIDNGNGSLGNTAMFKMSSSYTSLMFQIRAKNTCGWGDWQYVAWSGLPVGYSMKSTIEQDFLPEPISPSSVRVYNLNSGQLVYSEREVTNFSIENTILGKGVYILETTNAEGKVTREKVMKTSR